MGADIHSFAEVRTNGKWQRVDEKIFTAYGDDKTSGPFETRNYGVFGFLADVRNYSCCQPISQRKGLPDDSEWLNEVEHDEFYGDSSHKQDFQENYHSLSWLALKELVDFDYEQTFWDRRVTKQTGPNSWNGAALADEGEGEVITYRQHLGEGFFNDLEVLKTLGAVEDVRIVFGFDS